MSRSFPMERRGRFIHFDRRILILCVAVIDDIDLYSGNISNHENFHAIATLAQLINPRAPYQRVRLFVY